MIKRRAKPRHLKYTVNRLMSYIFRYKWRFLTVIACTVVVAIANVSTSLFLQRLIDDYITPMLSQSRPDFMPLLRAISFLAGIYISGVIAIYILNRMMVTITQGTLKNIRDDLFRHMETLPVSYFDTTSHGDIMSHFTNDVDALRQMISQGIPQIIASVIMIVTIFTAMIVTNRWLTLVVLVFVGLMIFVAGTRAQKSSVFFKQQQAALGELNGYVEEMISGQKVVQVFNYEERSKERFGALNEELRKNTSAANEISMTLMPINFNIGNLQYIVLAIIGGVLISRDFGGLTLGVVATFLQLSKNFNQPISQVSQQANAIILALAGAERIFEVLNKKPEQDSGSVVLRQTSDVPAAAAAKVQTPFVWYDTKTDVYTPCHGDIVFDRVDFGYTADELILKDINLYAHPGQKVALVGATGAGKTTIINLINRFYDIQKGHITYDGIDINHIKKNDLRKAVGIVLQDVNLFTGTVLENIRYGRLDATDEECIKAAERVNADGFIRRLPQGYHTVLGGSESNLSQGQRQLLSIARAEVANPPVMILDEATSSIDTRTERIVQDGMDSLMSNRTTFVIAHRLSTVQNSDVIMVLADGEIIERGSHDELVAQKGKYYQLYTGAFELE
ncbi:ABC transporter ATP-binding protein [Vagococcus acidifermentans]|uniref:ABC transporter n=1 Tax=Vagococcus acidifermentans TaxID=564710 RepID=A0A430B336_9ENTE|nr:ABC transporter ATP-binding protein [Vagococcus acidifermentans]RSU14757.1 ABC transporter [Vagococcus acidifermentans]